MTSGSPSASLAQQLPTAPSRLASSSARKATAQIVYPSIDLAIRTSNAEHMHQQISTHRQAVVDAVLHCPIVAAVATGLNKIACAVFIVGLMRDSWDKVHHQSLYIKGISHAELASALINLVQL